MKKKVIIGVLILLIVCTSGCIEPIESLLSRPEATPIPTVTPTPTSQFICNPHEVKCNGNLLQKCSSTGLKWITITECQFGCENGACIAKQRWYWKEVTVTIYPRILTRSGVCTLTQDEWGRVMGEVDGFSDVLNSYGILVNVHVNNNTLPGTIIGFDGWLKLNQLSRDSKGDDIIIWNDGGVWVAYGGTASHIRRTDTAYCTIPVRFVNKEILVHEWLHIVDWNHRYTNNHYDPDQCESYGFSWSSTDGWMPCYIWMIDQYYSEKAEEYGWR